MDIVTLSSTGDTGTIYEYQQGENTPVYMLFSDKVVNVTGGGSLVGQRVLIAYSTPDNELPTSNTSIDIQGLASVINGSLTITSQPDTLETLYRNEVYLRALWMTGRYLNIYTMARNDFSAQNYLMIADAKTVNDSIPTVYLLNASGNNIYSTQSDCFSSFNVESLWSSDAVKGLKIKVNNEANIRDTAIVILKNKAIYELNNPI